ncbi:hypothetical protein B0H17DRAFT_1188009 [Mycena rosella]|uniref:DUF6589 domain-containing protein n=1 Tax=Mycena rosella TaxID=1033263 RepID=A0AAD7BP08_MYCRO|nr:hypothetical protein B0H17DRAFT_1188009 [Mycena rosella]
MSRNYSIRPSFTELGSADLDNEPDAESTVGATSSPPGPYVPDLYVQKDVPFLNLGSDDLRDEEGDLTYGSNSQARKFTDTKKTLAVLEFMKEEFSRFSLKAFLQELFTSEHASIKNVTNSYLATGGGLHLLETAIGDQGMQDPDIGDWIMAHATEMCSREVTQLTTRASEGPHFADAQYLRVPANAINIDLLQSFSVPGLLKLYEQCTTWLQTFLKAVIGRDSPPPGSDESAARCQRNPDMTNLHGAINTLMLWDGRVPKRLVQTLNRYGFCTSYLYQIKAVGIVSKDAVMLARSVANDPEKLLLLPYDNYNWRETAWETSEMHGNISHDKVSALLVVLDLPPNLLPGEAGRLASVNNFAQTARTRHHIPPDEALEGILPTDVDQRTFADNAVKHVGQILCDEIAALSSHRNDLPEFFDPHALPAAKTEEYFLPTYDQEQSFTRGDMLVIEHYYPGPVLRMPKEFFESQYAFLLGDRLTTAHDRAAQDQRAVDHSEHRVDHLSSFEVLSGIMYVVMNQIQSMGKNAWGSGTADLVGLSTLLSKLPNRKNINLRKIDFYAWLRFMDAVLHALVLRAVMVVLNVSPPQGLEKLHLSASAFETLCNKIVAQFLLPSIDCLEAEEVKTLPGSTESGNAVLLMHDLMTLREMHHAIEHGHPERMERMLKYWTPMFYAGGSFNYANKLIELLHNLNHDWPSDISPILRNGMLMLIKNQGKATTFKETDIRVEQFNKTIKSHAHGANARPGLLEKITPAIGHIQELTEQIFEDLGVLDEDQHHAKVKQHKDIMILLDHLCQFNIFDFLQDKLTEHTMVDLYRTGLHRLAGPDGGHAKHLCRHVLRSRTRHFNEMPTEAAKSQEAQLEYEESVCELQGLDRELELDNEYPS